jgi:hypothetical protein
LPRGPDAHNGVGCMVEYSWAPRPSPYITLHFRVVTALWLKITVVTRGKRELLAKAQGGKTDSGLFAFRVQLTS